jgi:thioredoxin 2
MNNRHWWLEIQAARYHIDIMEKTIHISCANCGATNRVPDARLHQHPSCGRCKQALFNGKPIELTAANSSALLAHTALPILVDCWAPWCGPCRSFAPVFEQAAKLYEPRMRLAKLNTEQEQALAAQWQIRSIPTLLLFSNGREQQRIAGAMSLAQLQQWLQQAGINPPRH